MLSNSGPGKDWEFLDCKEIKPINPKGNQPWIFIGSTVAEAEAPTLAMQKAYSLEKDSDARRDWRQREEEAAEGDLLRQHPWLNPHEFEQTPGDSEWQRSLACSSPWGHRVRHDWVAEQQQQMPWSHSVHSFTVSEH